jgi:hypothetical protein
VAERCQRACLVTRDVAELRAQPDLYAERAGAREILERALVVAHRTVQTREELQIVGFLLTQPVLASDAQGAVEVGECALRLTQRVVRRAKLTECVLLARSVIEASIELECGFKGRDRRTQVAETNVHHPEIRERVRFGAQVAGPTRPRPHGADILPCPPKLADVCADES